MGHRGAAAYATENTLSSLQTAIDCQVDMVEMDVRRTKDGVLVLSHSPHLVGLNQRKLIRRTPYAKLQQICLDGGEMMPTLEEALAFVKGKAQVNLDLKEAGLEPEVVALVEAMQLQDQVMFSSVNKRSLHKVKQANPNLYTTLSFPSSKFLWLYEVRPLIPVFKYIARHHKAMWPAHFYFRKTVPFNLRRLAGDHIDAVIIRAPFISSKLVDVAHGKEWKLYTWPVDEPQDMVKLQKLGVDGVVSNKPDILHAAVIDEPDLATS